MSAPALSIEQRITILEEAIRVAYQQHPCRGNEACGLCHLWIELDAATVRVQEGR